MSVLWDQLDTNDVRRDQVTRKEFLRGLIVCPSGPCRSSRAVLQSDVVPQPGSGPDVHASDRLRQRPLYPPLGQEEALHPGALCGNTDGRGAVPERLFDR